MPWITDPTEEQILTWYSQLFRLCQVPEANKLVNSGLSPLAKLPLTQALDFLGKVWNSMEKAYSRRPELGKAFDFIHRLTSRGLAMRHAQGGPRLLAGPTEPQRYFNAVSNANRLIHHAENNEFELEARFSFLAFANQLLLEGAIHEVQDRLVSFAIAGSDYANLPTARQFMDPEYLVDGNNVLRSEERGKPVPHLLLRRIRNVIAHARFDFDSNSSVAVFHDVHPRDPSDTYLAEMTFEAFMGLTKSTFFLVSIATAYLVWLQLWSMTSAGVADIIDLGTLRVRDEIRA